MANKWLKMTIEMVFSFALFSWLYGTESHFVSKFEFWPKKKYFIQERASFLWQNLTKNKLSQYIIENATKVSANHCAISA